MSDSKQLSKQLYSFEPVGVDVWDPRPNHPGRGARVRIGHPGYGAPQHGSMGHTYIYSEDGDVFHGMVLINSLKAIDS